VTVIKVIRQRLALHQHPEAVADALLDLRRAAIADTVLSSPTVVIPVRRSALRDHRSLLTHPHAPTSSPATRSGSSSSAGVGAGDEAPCPRASYAFTADR
jgi:hypothetical protein